MTQADTWSLMGSNDLSAKSVPAPHKCLAITTSCLCLLLVAAVAVIEEGKADVLGLYMIKQLIEKGAITEGTLDEYYTTFLSGIFRSVRFGASSAHGKANMIRFNYFQEKGAFTRNKQGLYSVNNGKMTEAINNLSQLILTLQGNGDYQGVAKLVASHGIIKTDLDTDLTRLAAAKIPVDIVFKQGKNVLGL